MARDTVERTHEDPRDPTFVDTDALEDQLNTINRLLRRDRWRGRREWAQTAAIVVLGAAVSYAIQHERVFVYEMNRGLDGIERYELLEPYTVQAGDILRESREWLEQVRIVSPDVVLMDKFRISARKRMDTPALQMALDQYLVAHSDMPRGWTRDVLEDTFEFTQTTGGEQGHYTFSWQWVEVEQFNYEDKGAYRMFATVTMRVRPPDRKEMRAGKLDAVFVAQHDIRQARQLNEREVAALKRRSRR